MTYLRGYRVDRRSFLASEARQCKTASQGWGVLVYSETRNEDLASEESHMGAQHDSAHGSRDCSPLASA